MIQIGISDISKNPSIIDKLDDIAQIVNKKSKQVKGIFIPSGLLLPYQDMIDELEYQKFRKRNANMNDDNEDDTLLDGLDNAY
jgi:hypothetical protein